MATSFRQPFRRACGAVALMALAACAPLAPPGQVRTAPNPGQRIVAQAPLPAQPLTARQTQQWLDRVTWGGNDSDAERLEKMGLKAWLEEQLAPHTGAIPGEAQQRIVQLPISSRDMTDTLRDIASQRRAIRETQGTDQAGPMQQELQRQLNQMAADAQKRQVLRNLYSPWQLQEQMTWFWMNHFNVSTRKGDVRQWVGDYEEHAIRAHALGNFRTLLEATLRHPAMLLYLDNASNAAGHINENYARELLELHTMGVGSGYTQADVQAMAHVLTGVGITTRDAGAPPPKLRPELQHDYMRQGFFEFNPARHDYTPQVFLGQPLNERGMRQVDEALDRIVASPATAHFIARKLAVFFIGDNPPPALVERTATAFAHSRGDIGATLATLLTAPEAQNSFGQRFKDPAHYVIGATRLAYDQRVATDVSPLLGWINRLGEPFYGHETPDGYPQSQSDWASSGQMAARFEVARQLATRGAVLFRTEPRAPLEKPPYPSIASRTSAQARISAWSEPTRAALAQARNPEDWNTYFLSAPEMMFR